MRRAALFVAAWFALFSALPAFAQDSDAGSSAGAASASSGPQPAAARPGARPTAIQPGSGAASVASEDGGKQGGPRLPHQWSLGLNVAETITALVEKSGAQVPVSLTLGYDFAKNFQAHSTNLIRFPLRGGYIYTISLGLRAHSPSLAGFTAFLGTEVGYRFTNVAWVTSDMLLHTYLGARYVTPFYMFFEAGGGGSVEFFAKTVKPYYFFNIGYVL